MTIIDSSSSVRSYRNPAHVVALVAGFLALFAPAGRLLAQATVVTEPCAARADAGAVSNVAPSDTTRTTTSPSGTSARSAPVDVVIYAAASAREVRFNSQPELHVRLCGGMDSIHVLDRRNLPSPVVVGTTYRDVYVAVEIFGRMNADCIAARGTGKATDADCASLEVRNAPPSRPARPPGSAPDSIRPPRR